MATLNNTQHVSSTIVATALNAEAFTPFGDVIEVSDRSEVRSINEGHTSRYHDLADLTLDADGGIPAISIFRSQPQTMPVIIRSMERHPLSSQAFFPVSKQPYLVIVAPKGEFNPLRICAFIAQPGQGVNYHPGTWHHYSLALNSVSDFLVVDRIVTATTNDDNCDEVDFSQPILVSLERQN
ncbi:MAG: ureidoglycolate lyase [Candidatus Pseudothioglobus sp.]|jgi:ureidoglycolate lyase